MVLNASSHLFNYLVWWKKSLWELLAFKKPDSQHMIDLLHEMCSSETQTVSFAVNTCVLDIISSISFYSQTKGGAIINASPVGLIFTPAS